MNQSDLDNICAKTRQSAIEKLGDYREINGSYSDPFTLLENVEWGKLVDWFDLQSVPTVLRGQRARFDLSCCFGRAVLASLLLEKYFPNSDVQVAEVVRDRVAYSMRRLLRKVQDPHSCRQIAAKILIHEEPHFVLSVDGLQFDPSVCVFSWDLKHMKVRTHNVWPAITAIRIVTESLSVSSQRRLFDLEQADCICSGMRMTEYVQCHTLAELGDDIAVECLRNFTRDEPNARTLFLLYLLRDDLEIRDLYPPEIFQLLHEEECERAAQDARTS